MEEHNNSFVPPNAGADVLGLLKPWENAGPAACDPTDVAMARLNGDTLQLGLLLSSNPQHEQEKARRDVDQAAAPQPPARSWMEQLQRATSLQSAFCAPL